jgi:hypothetical protein
MAIAGQPTDVAALRQRAALVLRMGQEMRDSAPPDIRPQFEAVVTAITTIAGRLESGGTGQDLAEPFYNDQAAAAFKAVGSYGCR